eukprot:3689258-Alexandrium_andersonii.AAC.1
MLAFDVLQDAMVALDCGSVPHTEAEKPFHPRNGTAGWVPEHGRRPHSPHVSKSPNSAMPRTRRIHPVSTSSVVKAAKPTAADNEHISDMPTRHE